jgi:hypothetical protein
MPNRVRILMASDGDRAEPERRAGRAPARVGERAKVTDACYPRHRHQEFPKFLKKAATACPGREVHVVCGNYAVHLDQGRRRDPRQPQASED